jgi:nucleoside-diphosphate-sugar epimerase
MASELHVIFGTGPVGSSAARFLLNKGLRVRMVNRSGRRPALLDADLGPDAASLLEVRSADAASAGEVLAVTEGATHIYHCANVLYQDWYRVLPVFHANLRAAALHHGAVLALAQNLYMYARGVSLINEDTEVRPPSRKGMLQQGLHQALVDAGEKQGLRWVSVRASDYYGPGADMQSVFGTVRFLDPLFAGKRPAMIGDPDLPHTYTYVDDYGRSLATAALRPEAHGKAWIVPNDRTLTTREVAAMFFTAVGRPTDLGKLPRPLITMMGIFNPLLRELTEVLYQKEEEYVVDGGNFQRRFGFAPTTLEEGVRRTVEWYRALHSAPAARAA